METCAAACLRAEALRLVRVVAGLSDFLTLTAELAFSLRLVVLRVRGFGWVSSTLERTDSVLGFLRIGEVFGEVFRLVAPVLAFRAVSPLGLTLDRGLVFRSLGVSASLGILDLDAGLVVVAGSGVFFFLGFVGGLAVAGTAGSDPTASLVLDRAETFFALAGVAVLLDALSGLTLLEGVFLVVADVVLALDLRLFVDFERA